MMQENLVALTALVSTMAIHLLSTVWWAASVTRRVEHVERWITTHADVAERLVALEQKIEHLGGTILRIEQFLRQNG